MSRFLDFEEKSVDKAIEKACQALSVDPEELKYDIISYGSSGIFGLVGVRKALIRVSVPEQGAAAGPEKIPADASDTFHLDDPARDPGTEHASQNVMALVDEAFGNEYRPGATPTHPEKPDAEPFSEENRSKQDIPAETDSIAEWVSGFLERALGQISPDSGFTSQKDGEMLRFSISGGESARLIGKRGQTLDALQYLVDKIVYKRFDTRITVEIDVENYLDRRKGELTELATRLAKKALETGKPMVINRINSHDRRIVHLALKENREIRTQSAGNGDLRKLLILPRKKAGGKKITNPE